MTNVSNFGHGISLPIVIPLSTFAIIVWKSMDYVFSTSLEACPPIRYMFAPWVWPVPCNGKRRKSSLVHAQDLSKIEQTGLSKQAKGVLLAPSADKLKAIVWIDGEEVPVLMKSRDKRVLRCYRIRQCLSADRGYAQTPENILPYRIFKVELTDLENGDRGEGLLLYGKRRTI